MLYLIVVGLTFAIYSHTFGQILVEEVLHQHLDDLASFHNVLRLAYL